MTGLEILDSAVKIGMGAIVGGVFGIVSPLLLAKKEVAMDRRTRRLRQMEDVLAALEGYFTFIIQHASNTSYFWTCTQDNLPDLPDVKMDLARDKQDYDAKHGLSISAMTKLVLLGHLKLEQQVREISDMMHAGLEELEKPMSAKDREDLFYDLRKRFGERRRTFFADFRSEYAAEPELDGLWPQGA